MIASSFTKVAIAGALLLVISSAHAQQRVQQRAPIDFGKAEYERKCAICHGLTGKGDGPMAAFITRKIPDLTTLAKNNNGVLPVSLMVAIIAGEKELPAHGSRDMPIWGTIFRAEGFRAEAEHYPDILYDADAYVRGRILMIVDYVNRLQVK
jgi:mono/diheme cytochrome c family protein